MGQPISDFGQVLRSTFRFARWMSYGLILLLAAWIVFRVAEVARLAAGVHPLLGVAVGTLAVAVVLFATGHWPYGLIVLGVAALLVAALVDLVGRRPELPATRAAQDARERTRSVFETWRTRLAVSTEVRRIQHGLARVDADRRSASTRHCRASS